MNAAARAARPTAQLAGEAAAQDPRPSEASKARRPDRRAARTIDKIMAAAQEAMLDYGTSKLSVSDVCEKAGVSRGTLYRYFSSMDDVLQAVALRLRNDTDEELRQALEQHTDPTSRFAAFLEFTASNRETSRAARFLHVEPDFVLRYFDNNFSHFMKRVDGALGSVYDAWEEALGHSLDRDAINEMMVRFALSETLIPASSDKAPLPIRLRALVDMVLRAHLTPKKP
jgi:AcrR family transcriptional regulator